MHHFLSKPACGVCCFSDLACCSWSAGGNHHGGRQEGGTVAEKGVAQSTDGLNKNTPRLFVM